MTVFNCHTDIAPKDSAALLPPPPQKKKNIYIYTIFVNGATIRKLQEIQCLQYEGLCVLVDVRDS